MFGDLLSTSLGMGGALIYYIVLCGWISLNYQYFVLFIRIDGCHALRSRYSLPDHVIALPDSFHAWMIPYLLTFPVFCPVFLFYN